MRTRARQWLMLIASGGMLMQATGGCLDVNPGQAAINTALATGVQNLIGGVIGLYLKAAVNQVLHI